MRRNLITVITMFIQQAVRQKKRPLEIALNTDEGKSVSMSEAIAATERIWQSSIRNGTDQITLEEIDTEIAAARKERKLRGVRA